ncbi:probable RNA methyltransferase At5g51130 [Lolium rigidum]|uniref:probable RNA methyltransferase At5g51130 n=1 Tax=Lolium rigidum TaxID=89674 RepID=UPI001F5D801D|nr:probable RNA methyltransferase At5g51130 [Lolium rigidum]
MVTTASPEDAVQPPPEAKGAQGEAKRKQSDAPARGGEGGGGGGGRGGGRGGGGQGKKRKNKEVFIYGNYRNYYGYRIDHNVGEDPRLEIFRKEWFAGKDCLDIGCNQGLVTIGLAMKFECRSILGVDIDSGLIETAKWNLRTIARAGKVATKSAKVHNSSDSTTQSCPEVVSEMSNGNISVHKQHDLFEIVSFRPDNFVQSTHRYSEQYDTIMCLSVTKWIHLNWGDDGIITLFVKIWSLLRPGGIFIMEPQPWISYKKNRSVSEVARENFYDICIYPEKFREILLDKVGFRSVEVITDRLTGSVAGFDRPIEVYHK